MRRNGKSREFLVAVAATADYSGGFYIRIRTVMRNAAHNQANVTTAAVNRPVNDAVLRSINVLILVVLLVLVLVVITLLSSGAAPG